MTDIQTAIREDFTAEHVAHLRSDARYLEARIAIAERNADAAEWEVELWTERGNTVAATRHAWKAAYHRAAADFMHQLTTDAVETVETVECIRLDAEESAIYDSGDDIAGRDLARDIKSRVRDLLTRGVRQVEVLHAVGFVAWVYDLSDFGGAL